MEEAPKSDALAYQNTVMVNTSEQALNELLILVSTVFILQM